MGPWFEVIAGGTRNRSLPRSKTATTFNFEHEMQKINVTKDEKGVKFICVDAVRYMGPKIITSTKL